jgi:hypothetical protein
MKKRNIAYASIILVSSLIASCMEEDEKYAQKIEAAGDITFAIPAGALTAPPAGQEQVTQPSLNIVAGRFATTDDVKMTIGLTEGFSNLSVKAIATSTGKTTDKGSFSGVNGSVDFTYPVSTLDVDNKAPAAGGSVTLLFTASNADNSLTTTRAFTVNVVDPFALSSTTATDVNPTTAYADSTISIFYRTLPSTSLENVTKVEMFAKRGVRGEESLVSSKDYATRVTPAREKFTFQMPSEIPGQNLSKLDTMFFRVRATFATGKTSTKNTTVRFISVPLSKVTTGVAVYNPAVTGANNTKIAYDFSKLAYTKTTDPADAESVKDLIVTVTGSDIGFTAGVGNTTTYVKVAASLYAPAATAAPLSYQSIRNAFAAGTAVTTVASAYVNDVFVAKIDGGKGSAEYVIFKVTAVNLTPPEDNADNMVIEIKSK